MPQADNGRPAVARDLSRHGQCRIRCHPRGSPGQRGDRRRDLPVREGRQPSQRGVSAPVHASAPVPVRGSATPTRSAEHACSSTSGPPSVHVRSPTHHARPPRRRVGAGSLEDARPTRRSRGGRQSRSRGAVRFWATEFGGRPGVAERYGYSVTISGVGVEDPEVGAPSQLATFVQVATRSPGHRPMKITIPTTCLVVLIEASGSGKSTFARRPISCRPRSSRRTPVVA